VTRALAREIFSLSFWFLICLTSHSLIFVSQNLPVNPGWQLQVKLLMPSTQVALFWQELLAHSSMFTSQFTPEMKNKNWKYRLHPSCQIWFQQTYSEPAFLLTVIHFILESWEFQSRTENPNFMCALSRRIYYNHDRYNRVLHEIMNSFFTLQHTRLINNRLKHLGRTRLGVSIRPVWILHHFYLAYRWQGSNSRPFDCEPSLLPTRPQLSLCCT